jgi:hypothetical protein
MFEFYATFDYNSITDPVSGSEYDYERDAYAQWEAEFHETVFHFDAILLGYRVLSRSITERRVPVRFLTRDVLSAEEQAEAIQTILFDTGALSGRFALGQERPFYVTYEVTREVWALDAEQARSRVPDDVVRVEDPEEARREARDALARLGGEK